MKIAIHENEFNVVGIAIKKIQATTSEASITTYQPHSYHFSKKKKNLFSLRMLMILTLFKYLQMMNNNKISLEIEGKTENKKNERKKNKCLLID